MSLEKKPPVEPIPPPNEEFPGRVPTDITFSCLLILVIVANIFIVIKLKVYKNFNSFIILVCLTLS